LSKLITKDDDVTIEGVDPPDVSYPTLERRIATLAENMEKMNVAEYIALVTNPRRMLWVNFLAGSARGVGLGIGVAVLSALILYILRGLMLANLPFIGDFIATIVRLTEQNLNP
jgi:hypothetical protein